MEEWGRTFGTVVAHDDQESIKASRVIMGLDLVGHALGEIIENAIRR